MVEVFKTNITCLEAAESLLQKIKRQQPTVKPNFDLEDCDCILRIEGEGFCADAIIQLLTTAGYCCEVLED